MDALAKEIFQLKESQEYDGFDDYMIRKMLGEDLKKEVTPLVSPQQRVKAYRECISRMGENRVASIQTIQKWFGIHGKVVPNREMVFKLGFSLGFSEKEVSDVLKRGILQPDFQVNDYREIIFWYGYQNGMNYDECLELIDKFQAELPLELEINQHNYTNDILEAMQEIGGMCQEEFFQWMLDHAVDFKGYSMTVLKYFNIFKREILEEIREDALSRLEDYLEEAGYFVWEQKRGASPKNRKRNISKFVEKELWGNREKEGEVILEMRDMAYISVESNTELLAELYASVRKESERMDFLRKGQMNLMDDKHLSELLNVGIHKEKFIRLSQLGSLLKKENPKNRCPKWVEDMVSQYGYKVKRKTTVSDIQKWQENELKKQGRRCCIMSRQDLLPLILCVAQKRYEKQTKGMFYDCQEAKRQFCELADRTLRACRMEPLSPKRYKADALLLMCFQEDDLYSLADILEQLADVQNG